MDLSAIIKAVLSSPENRPAAGLPPLQPGDRLVGRVLRLEADGRALIDLGRFRVLAQTAVAIQPGQTLSLKVEQVGMPLHLRIDPLDLPAPERPAPQMALTDLLEPAAQRQWAQIVARLAAPNETSPPPDHLPEKVRQALLQIRSILTPMPSPRAADQLARWLRSAMEDCGVLFEKKLADAVVTAMAARPAADPADAPQVRALLQRDLKPQLLILKTFLAASEQSPTALADVPPKDVVLLRQTVERLLTHVEQQQARVIQRGGDPDLLMVLTHLLPVKDQSEPVRLKIYYPQRGRQAEGGQQQHVALLLNMDRLGTVRADVAMQGRHLRIHFFVQDEPVRQTFEEQSHAVSDALAGIFEQVHIGVQISPDKIAQFDREDLAAPAKGRIDIQA